MKVWKVWCVQTAVECSWCYLLWIILKVTSLWSCSFSRRLKVFKGLKVDTVLRNFTVFEYTKNKVSDMIFHLNICESCRVNVACEVTYFVAWSMVVIWTQKVTFFTVFCLTGKKMAWALALIRFLRNISSYQINSAVLLSVFSCLVLHL